MKTLAKSKNKTNKKHLISLPAETRTIRSPNNNMERKTVLCPLFYPLRKATGENDCSLPLKIFTAQGLKQPRGDQNVLK
jgi:hypothetical protein